MTMEIMYLVVGLLLFVGLVVVHEFGHFIAARRGGVEVEEFGIGFPPTFWKKKLKSGLLLTLNALPLGGFVKLKGENDAATGKGTYGAARLSTKVRIMLAGVVMNLAAALLLFTAVAVIGMPQAFDNQFQVASDAKVISDVRNKGVISVNEVLDNSPAQEAGIQKDDQIVKIGDRSIDSPEALTSATEQYGGQTVVVELKRGTEAKMLEVTLNTPQAAEENGYLGIRPISLEEGLKVVRSTWSAPIVAAGTMAQFTQLTMKGLGTALGGLGSILAGFVSGNDSARQVGQAKASEQVSGPVGIFVVLREGSRVGFGFVLFIVAILSLTLAIMNVLPIPALDGGRLFVTLLFRAIKKPLTKDLEERIHGTGFAVLMVLFLVITVVDVRRFF